MPNTKTLLKEISEACRQHCISIAVAESVTAGAIQYQLSQMPETQMVFNGGLTAYNIGQKVKLLGLDFIDGDRCNCVSEHTSKVMALNVCHLFNSKLGIGITGYASPVPEENIYDVNAFLVISLAGTIIYSEQLGSKAKGPDKVQLDFAQQSIAALAKCVKEL